jgi:hypothetical protein
VEEIFPQRALAATEGSAVAGGQPGKYLDSQWFSGFDFLCAIRAE